MIHLFTITVILSSALLFIVQPLCARMVLPTLGGTPAVWTTCMVFFQAGLLLGYAYAHWLPRWLGWRRHAFLHVGLLVLALTLLPIQLDAALPPRWPIAWLLSTLLI